MDDALHNVNQWRTISSLAVLTLVLAWESLVAMFTVVQMHHANISLPGWLDRALRVIIVTPFMHKVHHSRWQPETDSNYSSLFSFWDRLFRSFRLRDDPRTLRFGLDEFNRPEDHTLRGLLATPLKQVQRATGEPPAKSASDL
jgi:sterol desaturase/sphingolipid hydroxylase (fatty acid hydroxylase superfamily)